VIEPRAPADAPSGHLAALDGLRAIAAVTVFVYHLLVLAPQVSKIGGPIEWEYYGRNLDLGVEIFFVLSGFLLARPFFATILDERRLPAWRTFALRRALRIYPAWLAFLAIAITTNQFTFLNGTPVKPDDPKTVLQWATLTHTWFFDPAHSSWTLSVEVSFYVALPLFAWFLAWPLTRTTRRPSVAALVAACALVTVIGFGFDWAHAMFVDLERFVPAALLALGPGMALAALDVGRQQSAPLDRRIQRCVRPTLVWWLGAGAVFLVMSRFVSRSPYVILGAPPPPREIVAQSVLQTVVACILVGTVAFGDARSFAVRIAGWRPLAAFGTISYSFYLWHLLVLYQWDWSLATTAGAAWSRGAMALAITIAIATVSYWLIERPAMQLGRRLTVPRR
jgi:peptidoglycan/LPS O-acetylase OafA/YrhL